MSTQAYILTEEEKKQINVLIDDVVAKYKTAEDEEFIQDAKTLSAKLPTGLREYFLATDDASHSGLLLIKGVGQQKALPTTPKTWFIEDSYKPDFRSDYLAIIFASMLGEPFGFETQQTGKLIHDILPIKGREFSQEGANSLQMLNFHTEDTFHPYRADYICLTCMRNPQKVGTLLAGLRDLDLSDEVKATLFKPYFHHLSDDTHIEDIATPQFEPILFGDKSEPYIRFDYDFTVASTGNKAAEEAIEALNLEVQRKYFEINIEEGDFCFVDNYKWLHGRKSFAAKFDGKDRWLRRFNIKTDLNEAIEYRPRAVSRMLSFEPVNLSFSIAS